MEREKKREGKKSGMKRNKNIKIYQEEEPGTEIVYKRKHFHRGSTDAI